MAEEIKSVVEGLNQAFADFKKTNDERIKQIESKGAADPLLEQKLDRINGKVDELSDIKARIEQAETALARKSVHSTDGSVDLDKKAANFEAMCSKNRGLAPSGFDAKGLAEYRKGFREFMRKGDLMSLDAQKALSVGSDPDGGYTVEPDTNGRIVQKIFETSPMRQVAAVQTIGTDALEGLYDLNEASSGWVSETGARTATATPELGRWRIPVYEMYANPAATQKILDDSMVDIEAWLAGKVADKFSRTENTAFVVGDGIGKPRGFTTYASGTTLPGTIEQVPTGVNGGFATDGTGGDPLITTIYSLKQAYRSSSRWFQPRAVTSAVRKIKDSNGMYIWQPGIAANAPATLLGFPILEMEDMPTLGTGSLSMAFGNMGEAYQIVDRQGIRVLRDPYTNKPYVQFYTVKRVGGDVINFEAIKLIRFGS